MNIEAMKQALEALEGWDNYGDWVWLETALEQCKRSTKESLTALRQAIAQAEKQEPVAFETWLSRQHGDPEEIGFLQALKISYEAGQDSASPRKEWVGLDVEDCRRIRRETERDERENVIQMTETILREKNT
jgi:hypothetical protein